MIPIARRGDFVLMDIGDKKGQIINEKTGEEFPPLLLAAILARGYWEPIPTKKEKELDEYVKKARERI